MNGPELRARMLENERLRSVPVVVLSALEVNRQKAGVAGAEAYLKKPIDPTDLIETIVQLSPRPGHSQEA